MINVTRSRGNSAEADRLGDGLEMKRRVTPVEPGGQDALVQQMQWMLLAIADGAHDLMATSRDAEARLGAERLRRRHRARGIEALARSPRGLVDQPARALHVA